MSIFPSLVLTYQMPWNAFRIHSFPIDSISQIAFRARKPLTGTFSILILVSSTYISIFDRALDDLNHAMEGRVYPAHSYTLLTCSRSEAKYYRSRYLKPAEGHHWD